VLRSAAFYDSSVLVPLCVPQLFSPRSLSLWSRYRAVVWWATQVEVASALARLLRRREISADAHSLAHRQAKLLAEAWRVVEPTGDVASGACYILERYPLRAADALQLAAALAWCEGKAQGNVFLTFDERLKEAAVAVGFTVE